MPRIPSTHANLQPLEGYQKRGTHLIQEAYLIRLSEIRVPSSRRTLINDTLISTFTYVHDQRRDVFTSLHKLKKSTKIYVDRGLVSNSRKLNKVIKILWKDVILTPLHVSSDHHACTHARKFLVSIWPSDRSKKNPKKSQKIYDQIWNIIKNNHSNLNAFDQEKDSLK